MRESDRPLTVEEIEKVANEYKNDLQREVERRVRQKDLQGALAAIQGKEYIDTFVMQLRMNARSRLHELFKPRAPRSIHISPAVRAAGSRLRRNR